MLADRVGAILRQLQVVLFGAAVVGVAFHADLRDLGMQGHDLGDRRQQRERALVDRGLVGREVDLLLDLDLVAAQHGQRRALVGAAVVVLEAVEDLGLGRALVDGIQEPVLVVVGIGAAVLVLEAVLVLGYHRALAGDVTYAVL